MSITTFFMLLGGLGLFLFGMKLMSEGLEKAAGAKMRGILEFFTKNRFIGMLVGILFTAVVQSSSADCIQPVRYRAAVRHGGRDHGHVLQETEHQEGRRSRAGIRHPIYGSEHHG